MASDNVTIRRARLEDESDLIGVDRLTQSSRTTPADLPRQQRRFFTDDRVPGDHVVAEIDGAVVGYVWMSQPFAMTSHQHAMEIGGLAVLPAHQSAGIGRSLLVAALEELRSRGIIKVSLRVLSWNIPALQLYRSCGFETEGVLHDEFLLDGEYVDDILMAVAVKGEPPESGRDRVPVTPTFTPIEDGERDVPTYRRGRSGG